MTNYNLIGNKIVKAEQHPLGYSAMELYEIPPNRFDPFEALDEIEQIVWENAGSKAPEDRLLNGLHALRAYITGMER